MSLNRYLPAIILSFCFVLLTWSLLLLFLSSGFSYDVSVAQMPIGWFTAILVGMGVCYAFFCIALGKTQVQTTPKKLLGMCIFIGFLARLILFASEPMLEDDYQRYMLDGAITASSHSPYNNAPLDLINGDAPPDLVALGEQSQPVLSRVNHPHLRTIYPPGAQLLFAAAAIIAPFKLYGLKLLYLLGEVATLLFLVKLLRHFKQPLIYLTLYWLNPIVIKELYNSAHMDGFLLPFLMGGLWALVKARPATSSALISVAATIKFWPALLLPLIWSSMKQTPRKCFTSIFIALLMGLVCVAPFIFSSLDETSGLLAYVQKWQTNSGFFALLQPIFETLHPMALRAVVAASLIALSVFAAYYAARNKANLLQDRANTYGFILIICAVFLLSPAQFPWYLIWLIPFLPLWPLTWAIWLTPLIHLYYLRFYFQSHGGLDIASPALLAIIWLPILYLLARDVRRHDFPLRKTNKCIAD